MKKRGQVAVEFLMTYGWALVAILGTLATLSYLGVFDFNAFVVEKCEFSSNVYCIDGVAGATGIDVVIQNGMAIDMQNIAVSIPDCNGSASGPLTLSSGEQATFSSACALTSTDVFNGNIYFNYTNPDSGLNHSKLGKVLYRVQ